MSEQRKIYATLALLFAGVAASLLPSNWLADSVSTSETIRVSSLAGALVLALLVFWFTQARLDFFVLIKEAKAEVLKVVWPTKQETTTYTITVAVFALLVAMYCWGIDKIIEWVLYDLILRLN